MHPITNKNLSGNLSSLENYNSRLQMENSIETLRTRAEHGEPQAQYELALHYESGKIPKKDIKKAFYWLL